MLPALAKTSPTAGGSGCSLQEGIGSEGVVCYRQSRYLQCCCLLHLHPLNCLQITPEARVADGRGPACWGKYGVGHLGKPFWKWAVLEAPGANMYHWRKNQGGWGGSCPPGFQAVIQKTLPTLPFVNKVYN